MRHSMGSRLLTIIGTALVLTLGGSTRANAEPVTFLPFFAGTIESTWFGTDGFFYTAFGVVFPGDATESKISTGPAVSVEPNALGGFDLTYEDGLLEVFGASTVLASIPIEPFTVTVTELAYEPINSTYFPLGTLVARYIDLFLDLGPGLLDAGLAAALGVSPVTLGGHLSVVIDDPHLPSNEAAFCIVDTTDLAYCGVPNDVAGRIDVQPVPEPALMGLLGLGMAAWMRRARCQRRSQTAR